MFNPSYWIAWQIAIDQAIRDGNEEEYQRLMKIAENEAWHTKVFLRVFWGGITLLFFLFAIGLLLKVYYGL